MGEICWAEIAGPRFAGPMCALGVLLVASPPQVVSISVVDRCLRVETVGQWPDKCLKSRGFTDGHVAIQPKRHTKLPVW